MKGLVVPTAGRDGPDGKVGPLRELPDDQPSHQAHVDQTAIRYRDSGWVRGHSHNVTGQTPDGNRLGVVDCYGASGSIDNVTT